ncbi:MAG TPA: sigma 54-interacting transcriptional regulator [Pseudomonadota bacterium]|nr:sigma 54-interacting transcriptional regulator [Pseudomonadota bacterium]
MVSSSRRSTPHSGRRRGPGGPRDRSTLRQATEDLSGSDESDGEAQPGLLLIFSGSRALWSVLPLAQPDGELELGRDNLGLLTEDRRISRRHARVEFRDGRFFACDLGSLNGTTIDGQPAKSGSRHPLLRCLRVGESLLLPVADIRAASKLGLFVQDGMVIGPRLASLYQRIASLAEKSTTLHITGESGAGKEGAARVFHSQSPVARGPFIAVNCATIPESIAERLLFGAKRGAFSGAVSDSEGYLQSAHEGTLFLDEVAELQASVQAKLLRVLETREVLPVGAVRPQAIKLRVVSASHRSLQAEVAAGRLREDLYYRIGRPAAQVPPLRERPEEIPWLITEELKRQGSRLSPHVSLIEACVLRPFPGNVRELLIETRSALHEASVAESGRLRGEHLAQTAGQLREPGLDTPAAAESEPDVAKAAPPNPSPPGAPSGRPSQAALVAALIAANLNLSETARRLRLHRTQLRRYIVYYGIDLEKLRAALP